MSRCCERPAHPRQSLHGRPKYLLTPSRLASSLCLRVFPPWRNMWLLAAIALSIGLHLMILYVPFFQPIFGVAPLDASEWALVLYVSVPVIIIEEILKLITRLKDPNRRSGVVVSREAASIGHGEKAV